MRQNPLLLSLFLACLASSASANTITYYATVNTSSLTGVPGSLDFQFDPGPLVTQSASLQILSFTSDGTLAGSPQTTGDASGTLPGTVTFDNGTGYNDYFEDFTYGTTLAFDVTLSGPALTSPDGTSTSGTTFAFSMFSDPGGYTPALTSDETDGFAFTVNVNLDGTTTLNNLSSQTAITTASTTSSATPEPDTAAMLGTALSLVGASLLFNKRRIPRIRGSRPGRGA